MKAKKKADRPAKAVRETATTNKQLEDCPAELEKQLSVTIRPEPLSPDEKDRLQQLESTIATGFEAWIQTAIALREIRDKKLYRETHSRFEDYLREKWDLSRPYAYQLMDSGEIAENLSAITDALPSPSTINPLRVLEPGEQREVYAEEIRAAPNGKPTAKSIKKAVARKKAKKAAKVLKLVVDQSGEQPISQPVKKIRQGGPQGQSRGEFIWMHFEQWVDHMEAQYSQFSSWMNRDAIIAIIIGKYPEDKEPLE